MENFLLILRFLRDLDFGYRFYFEHRFVNNWGTLLYALPREMAWQETDEMFLRPFYRAVGIGLGHPL